MEHTAHAHFHACRQWDFSHFLMGTKNNDFGILFLIACFPTLLEFPSRNIFADLLAFDGGIKIQSFILQTTSNSLVPLFWLTELPQRITKKQANSTIRLTRIEASLPSIVTHTTHVAVTFSAIHTFTLPLPSRATRHRCAIDLYSS